MRHIPTVDDGDFTWEKFETAYNNELGNELGNLVQRVVSMASRYQNGVLGELPRARHDTQQFYDELNELRFDRAFDVVWARVRGLNGYLEEVKPWEVAKKGDTEHLQEILAHAATTLTQIAQMLWPFMPTTSETIVKIFEGGTISTYKGVLFPKIYNHTPAPGVPKPQSPVATEPQK